MSANPAVLPQKATDSAAGSVAGIGPAPLMPGSLHDIAVADGVSIRTATAGDGPPLLLLHGHPHTHVTWRKIAPRLAERFTVVAADLRDYGDSSKREGGGDHLAYSKRIMARDQVEVMRAFGHDRFALVGHDGGARVSHRLTLDHPEAVSRLALLSISPTATLYGHTDKTFATHFWRLFLIQPALLPEHMINGDRAFFCATTSTARSRRPAPSRRRPSPNISAATTDRKPCMRSAKTIAPRRGSIWSTTPPARIGRSTFPCWLSGAPGTRLENSSMCWRPGANGRAMSADIRSIADTACRRSDLMSCSPVCWRSWSEAAFIQINL